MEPKNLKQKRVNVSGERCVMDGMKAFSTLRCLCGTTIAFKDQGILTTQSEIRSESLRLTSIEEFKL